MRSAIAAMVAVLLGGSLVAQVANAQQPSPSPPAQGRTKEAPLQAAPVTMPADRVCVYAGQIYSIGSVLNGQRCQQDQEEVFANPKPPPVGMPINKGR
jgi:hypothetical protein